MIKGVTVDFKGHFHDTIDVSVRLFQTKYTQIDGDTLTSESFLKAKRLYFSSSNNLGTSIV